MDPATLALIEAGFSIAGKFLDRFQQGKPHEEDAAARVQELDRFVQKSVAELDQSIQFGISTVINKIENDALELLLSRARNLSALLDMGRYDHALHYAMTLRESVDYARNRLEEEKVHWLGPFLGGSGIYLAAVDAAGARREADLLEFRKHLDEIKIELLDYVVPRMIESGVKVPWATVAHFTLGTTERLGELLAHLRVPEARAGVDDSIRGAGQPAKPPPLALPQPDMSVHALAVKWLSPASATYVSPNIPKAKLDGARKKVLLLAEAGDPILALIDLTVWGSAKECVGVFSSYIIVGSGGPPKRYEYASLPPKIATEGFKLFIGPDRYFMLDNDKANALQAFLTDVRSRG